MSRHAIAAGMDEIDLRRALRRALREPSGVVYGAGLEAPPTAVEFVPDLSPAEEATLDQALTAARRSGGGELDLEAALAANRATLAGYLANASPTQAQTAAALKALIRVVRALARES